MKVIITLMMIFLFSLTHELRSQIPNAQSSYLSVNLGGYKAFLGNSTGNRYTSGVGIGMGYGHALSLNSYLYSKLTYFSMPKFLAYEKKASSDNLPNSTDALEPVRASLSQFIFDLGYQHNFHLFKDYLFGIIGGISYTLFNQEARHLDGTIIQKLDNIGLFGYFAGINLEKNFIDDEVTVFGELQYNYPMKNSVNYSKVFSGINYTVGLRFYISRED